MSGTNEFVQALPWAHGIKDLELRSAIDLRIQREIEMSGYRTRPGEAYIGETGTHFNTRPDMTLCFVRPGSTIALCYSCNKEARGLHVHIFPQNNQLALDLLARVLKRVGNPITRIALLDDSLARLTWRYRWIPAIAILGVLSYLMSQSRSVLPPGVLTDTVVLLSGLVFVLLMVYLLGIMVFVLARLYYAVKASWRI